MTNHGTGKEISEPESDILEIRPAIGRGEERMDDLTKGTRKSLLSRIKEQEKLIEVYQDRLKENPRDLDIAETLMTLQVAFEELKKGL